MPLPIAPVARPADLATATNGKLPASLLTSYTFPGHRSPAQAHRLALRSFLALAAACVAATGVTLTITSIADAYRNYERQRSGFLARYEPVSYVTYLVTSSSRRRKWDGRYWRLRPGFAPMATPGTSNHGWALAFDVAAFASGTILSIASSKAWPWLVANAQLYGFSWELQSEPWHLRLVTGDRVPLAVLAFERGGHSAELIMHAPPTDPRPLDQHRVRWLQQIINERRWGLVTVDGNYGLQTAAAVRNMQRALGVTVDGNYGPQTAAALSRWLAKAA